MTRSTAPSLRRERQLLRSGALRVGGMDEVGRGALAGPVSVGIVVVDQHTRSAPAGVRDSKLLTPLARQRLAPALSRWGVCRAVGHASAAEIDQAGIMAALRLAAGRALSQLEHPPDVIILDGSHNWLAVPPVQPALFDEPGAAEPEPEPFTWTTTSPPAVVTQVKADRTCSCVAAASVLAKLERDAQMSAWGADPEFARYGWAENKGYSSADHLQALQAMGPSRLHRQSWRLPGVSPQP